MYHAGGLLAGRLPGAQRNNNVLKIRLQIIIMFIMIIIIMIVLIVIIIIIIIIITYITHILT